MVVDILIATADRTCNATEQRQYIKVYIIKRSIEKCSVYGYEFLSFAVGTPCFVDVFRRWNSLLIAGVFRRWNSLLIAGVFRRWNSLLIAGLWSLQHHDVVTYYRKRRFRHWELLEKEVHLVSLYVTIEKMTSTLR